MTTQDQVQDRTEPQRGRPLMPSDYGIHQGEEGLLTWEDAVAKLTAARNYWVSSTRPNGRPHAMPVWGVWLDGAFYFGTGRRSQKARNLFANPEIIVHLESGDDVVIIEGVAEELVDPQAKQHLSAVYTDKYNEGGDPGDSPYFVVRARAVQAWTERDFPKSATRWTFGK